MKNNQYSLIDHLKFIVPSLVGVFLFMLPIKTEAGLTIPIAILAESVQTLLNDRISEIMMIIIVITAVMTVIARIVGQEKFAVTHRFFSSYFASIRFGR
jgi:nucleoside recognition membrane protein YjiH